MRRTSKTLLTAVRLLAIGLTLTLVAAACGDDDEQADSSQTSQQEGDASEDDQADADNGDFEVTAAIAEDLGRIDTQAAHTPLNRITTGFGNVGEALTTTDADGELQPLLASDWELVDDTTWRFHLQEGVSFSNGEPFNAEAVVFSLDRIVSDEFGATHIAFFSDYESSAAVDEHTVDVTTGAPAPDLPRVLAMAMMVPPGHAVDFSPDGAQEEQPIGTGPYLFESRDAESVVLTKNSDYWGGAVEGPDTVTVLSRPEASGRVSALRAGEVDVINNVPLQSVDQVPNVVTAAPGQMVSLILNLQNGPTTDERVREAIALAIDKDSIRESFFGEFAVPGQCQFGVPGVIGFNEDLEGPGYDPDRARELISEAGAEGATIEFVSATGVFPSGEETSEVIAEQLEAVGLDVSLTVVDLQRWREIVFAEPDTRVPMFMVAGSFDLGTMVQPFGPFVVDGGRLSSIPYDEFPELDQQVQDALRTLDPEERQANFEAVNERLCELTPWVSLWSVRPVFGHSDDVILPEREDQNLLWKDVRQS